MRSSSTLDGSLRSQLGRRDLSDPAAGEHPHQSSLRSRHRPVRTRRREAGVAWSVASRCRGDAGSVESLSQLRHSSSNNNGKSGLSSGGAYCLITKSNAFTLHPLDQISIAARQLGDGHRLVCVTAEQVKNLREVSGSGPVNGDAYFSIKSRRSVGTSTPDCSARLCGIDDDGLPGGERLPEFRSRSPVHRAGRCHLDPPSRAGLMAMNSCPMSGGPPSLSVSDEV